MAKRRYLKGLTVSQRLAAYSVKDPEYGVTAYFIGQIKSRKRRAYVED